LVRSTINRILLLVSKSSTYALYDSTAKHLFLSLGVGVGARLIAAFLQVLRLKHTCALLTSLKLVRNDISRPQYSLG
jgi:hypothetical protein